MNVEHTERGFALCKFVDLDGASCSIQDSSLATEACVWLGVSKHGDGTRGDRMHLTQRMALKVARAMRAHGRGEAVNVVLRDRSACDCVVASRTDGRLEMGVVTGDEPLDGPSLMVLDADLRETLLQPLLAFVAGGTVESETVHDLEAETLDVHMDVKIPPSMLHRAEVGGTGRSVRDLVDALQAVLDGHSLETLRAEMGHDRTEDLLALHADLRPLRAD